MSKKQRSYVNDLSFLSIYQLRRGGHLAAGRFRLHIQWTVHSEQEFHAYVRDDRLRFVEPGAPIEAFTIRLQWTPVNFGGSRPWFICPGCERRVAKRAIQRSGLLCRHCIGEPPYLSKNGDEFEAIMDQIVRLRQRYNIPGLCGAAIEKPRYMHSRKFERIKARLQRLELEADILYMRKAQAILDS